MKHYFCKIYFFILNNSCGIENCWNTKAGKANHLIMTPSHGRTFCACTKPETKRNSSRCFFRRHELKSHDYDWAWWWIVQLLTSSRLFPLFLGWKCATSPRSEEWNGMAVKTAEHDVFQFYLERNFFLLFLNIEKVLQTTATTNGSETHSCQPKSQAAKSEWAKIETGLSLGNRWEMFYFMAGLRRGRARRRRHQLRTTFVRLGELVASIRRQFMSFCFTDVHPISCSSFFSLFAVCILINIIGSVWWPSYDRKLCIMLRMDFARHRTKKNNSVQNFHRNINPQNPKKQEKTKCFRGSKVHTIKEKVENIFLLY